MPMPEFFAVCSGSMWWVLYGQWSLFSHASSLHWPQPWPSGTSKNRPARPRFTPLANWLSIIWVRWPRDPLSSLFSRFPAWYSLICTPSKLNHRHFAWVSHSLLIEHDISDWKKARTRDRSVPPAVWSAAFVVSGCLRSSFASWIIMPTPWWLSNPLTSAPLLAL